MWYEEDANFMKQLVREAVPNAEIKRNRDAVRYLYKFQPAPYILPEVIVKYPGRKDALGDYKLVFGNTNLELKHSHICQFIYDYCIYGQQYSLYMVQVLRGIYENGLNANTNHYRDFGILISNKIYNFEQFKIILYWITLQEEINYPLSNGCMSVKLPFSRYLEAIIVAYINQQNDVVSINKIKNRADSKSPLKCWQEMGEIRDIHESIVEFSKLL